MKHDENERDHGLDATASAFADLSRGLEDAIVGGAARQGGRS